MRQIARSLACLLSVCLALSASGCFTGREYAEGSRRLVVEGMSMEEVAGQLGEPDLIVRGDPGTDTSWVYRFSGGPGTVATIFLIIFFVALIVVLVAASAKGGGGGFGGGGWGGGSD